ncbi:protein ALP1-like [Temnothorax curvispinosus]|uniref:Protein ALP1-like n=1 Tax=Temnothorax curvispinosus TaxID=300111 RepID=A0A6J1PS90_9HYME|nr:protein ALP1-like [Temnothorax curvispinosus]
MSESSSTEDSASSSSGDGEEDDDLLLFPLMLYLTSGQRRHRIQNYLQIIDSWTNKEYKQHLRLNRCTASKLIDELELSNFIPSHSFGVKPISAKLSFLLFLWYIANTEPLRTMSDRFDVSISSVFRVLRRVVTWLLTKFDSVIKWPQGLEAVVVNEQFSSKKSIPKVLGAIDGTHIRIEKPLDRAREYCNRKKYFSISLQAVADADMRFINVYCGDPGSLHDARILRRSELYHEASMNQEILFPDKMFLLGDSAYPSLPWLVPPFRDNGHLTPQQVEFNYIHSSTRMALERAFGQLKGRFCRIKFFTEYRDLPFVVNTVVAACILHNYCIEKNDTYDFPEVLNDCTSGITNDIEQEEIDNRTARMDRRTELFYELFPNCL